MCCDEKTLFLYHNKRNRIAYDLKLCDVLLPPEVLFVFWPRVCHEVIGVHADVDEAINGAGSYRVTT
jgi:hypothetical protein